MKPLILVVEDGYTGSSFATAQLHSPRNTPMLFAEREHSDSKQKPTLSRHTRDEAEEDENAPVHSLSISDGKKHRCHVCHLHVISGLPCDSVLGGRLTDGGKWEHFRCG
jgi:hypothetical protein